MLSLHDNERGLLMKLLHVVRVSCLSLAFLGATWAVSRRRRRPPAVSTPTPPAAASLVTTVEGIAEYRLDNGLRVLLFRDPSKATITVNMTYLVGSVDESYGETGMAHLLEHMLFKGSTKYPDILAATAQPRRAIQRHDGLGPHQLLRDVRRERRESRVGARPRSRSHGQRVRRARATSTPK